MAWFNIFGKNQQNYIESRNDALNIIVAGLSKYSYSKDRNLAVLTLWIVRENDSSENVTWADSSFIDELKVLLHQEMIEAIQIIEIEYIDPKELEAAKTSNKLVTLAPEQLYYTTRGLAASAEHKVTTNVAWLECIGGEEFLTDTVISLRPGKVKEWNIGRYDSKNLLKPNQIVISEDCMSVSRQHAAVIAENGKFYVRCNPGGCRARGGKLTKIIRADGSEDELVSFSHTAVPYLKDGDIIQLSKTIFLRFTTTRPRRTKKKIEKL